jgi:predicted dehydrogenase
VNRRVFLGTSIGAFSTAFLTNIDASAQAPATVAIIGHTGRGNYGHGMDTCWLHNPFFKIVGVADADEEGLRKAKVRLESPTAYLDYEMMLQKERPTFVSIAPRHIDQHAEMVLSAVKYGAKGIYIEKPFCRNIGEANAIIEAAESAQTKIALAHRNRYHPVLPKVQQLLQEGLLGELLEIRMRGKEDHRGGVQDLWVLGSHVINIAQLLTGGFTAVSATIFQDRNIAIATDRREGDEGVGIVIGNRLRARFDTKAGFPVFFDSIKGKGTSDANFGLQIIGTKGVLDFRVDTEPFVHYLEGNFQKPQLVTDRWVPISSAGINRKEPLIAINQLVEGHQGALLDLKDAVGMDKQPLCSMYEGLATIEAIIGVLVSHCSSGKRIAMEDLPLDNPLIHFK